MNAGRDLTMGRALESIPLPELPEDYYARLGECLEQERRIARPARRRRRLFIIAAAIIAIAIGIAGAALAGGLDPLRDTFDPLFDTFWPQNDNGQTYGTAAGAALIPGEEPDLIAVASDGKKGFCYKTDLNGAQPAGRLSRREWDVLEGVGLRGYGIPKYESDGTTQIGVFWLGAGSAGGSGGMSGRRETTADDHGTLITTKEAPGGAITITREWLDGRRKTNSAEDDPSLSRLPAAERPTTWRDITFWFRDDGLTRHGHTSSPPVAPAWLAERMSATALAAGDPRAVGRWTLTYRRCAAPLEGDAAPTDDAAKYTPVWIVTLQGDFDEPLPSTGSGPAPEGYEWTYLLLAADSHEVVARGTSTEPFDTSMFRLQGRTQLPAE